MPPKEEMSREVQILSPCCARSTRLGPGNTEVEPQYPGKAQGGEELALGISTQLIRELVTQLWKVPWCGSEVTHS